MEQGARRLTTHFYLGIIGFSYVSRIKALPHRSFFSPRPPPRLSFTVTVWCEHKAEPRLFLMRALARFLLVAAAAALYEEPPGGCGAPPDDCCDTPRHRRSQRRKIFVEKEKMPEPMSNEDLERSL